MRFETHTVRIGELLGPIDWDYDFRAWGWDRGGSCNPDLITERIAILREIDMGIKRGEDWEAFHGSDRAYRVWNVGMYDGWPYWSPTPSVRTDSALGGGEWHSWFCVSGARRILADDSAKGEKE